jgi:8-oxo-dGTP pyrophosphatase MutT (NUDIX family)
VTNPWRTLASKTVYENRWIRVREDRVVRPDGNEGIYGVIEIRSSVAIVALNGHDEIALVGQWRYTLGRYSWEIPRGGSEPGETDMAAVARRELREEAGVVASEWRDLGAVDLNNGVTTDVEHLFLATRLTHKEPEHDAEEKISVRWVPFDDAVRMVLRREITESCTVAAILLVNLARTSGAISFPLVPARSEP